MDGRRQLGDLLEVHTHVGSSGSVVLTLVGELDHQAVEPVAAVLADTWAHRPGAVTVDLRQLGFINARGLACLIRTSRTARQRGVPLCLLCSPGLVARLVVVVGLGDRVAEPVPTS